MATTKVEPKIAVAQPAPSERYEGLTPQRLIEIYRLMYQSRKIDDREIMLKRQQKIFFQISGAGPWCCCAPVGRATSTTRQNSCRKCAVPAPPERARSG